MSRKKHSDEKTQIREQELEHENELLWVEPAFIKNSSL